MRVLTRDARLAQLWELRQKIDAEIHDLTGIAMPRQRRSRFEIPPCGTESGYQRHRYRGEKCEECKIGHRLHERARKLRAKGVAA